MNITSTRKSVIGRVSLGVVTAATAATLLGACSTSSGHGASAPVANNGSAAHNIFSSSPRNPGDTGRIVLTAANSTQASEQAVQQFSNSLPDTPLFNAFKMGLFNATHNTLG